MSKPEELPDEVKIVLAHLKPEPEELAEERERLLAELDPLIASSQGLLQPLLERMRAVLVSRRPGATFQPHFAREFATALEAYRKDPSATPPPTLLIDCLHYLREHVLATGMGPLLAAVDESSPQELARAEQSKSQRDVQMRIKLGNTRG
jgi:hypothetical protein